MTTLIWFILGAEALILLYAMLVQGFDANPGDDRPYPRRVLSTVWAVNSVIAAAFLFGIPAAVLWIIIHVWESFHDYERSQPKMS